MAKKIMLCLGLTVFLALMFAAMPARAADVAKIGIVDLQKVLESSSAGKAAQAEIKREKDRMEEDLKKQGAEIEALTKQIERDSMVMSKDLREDKEREGRIKINDLKSLEKRYRGELQKLQRDKLMAIQNSIFEIAEAIGKKDGYLLILGKQDAGVLYAPSAIDITDTLIKRYDAQFAKTGKP